MIHIFLALIVSQAAAAGPQVTVCHQGANISISLSALPAHLLHGDYVGDCQGSSSSSSQSSSSSEGSSQQSSHSSSSSTGSSASSEQSSQSSEGGGESSSSQSSQSSESSSQSSGISSSPCQECQESSSSSSVQSEQSSIPETSNGDPEAGRTHERGNSQGAGGCRHGMPWCFPGATSGQYPLWFPSSWTNITLTSRMVFLLSQYNYTIALSLLNR